MVSITPIANLPAAITINGNEEIPAIQAGTGVRLTVAQIITFALGISLLAVHSEQLTVTATNTLSNLSMMPAAAFSMLVVNGQVFLPVGTSPAYSISGQTITWLSTTYSLQTVDAVYAVYTVES